MIIPSHHLIFALYGSPPKSVQVVAFTEDTHDDCPAIAVALVPLKNGMLVCVDSAAAVEEYGDFIGLNNP